MKKILSLLFSLVFVVFMLAACGSNNTGDTDKSDKDAASVKTGIAVTTSLGDSTNAGAENGLAQVDSTIAAVTVDADGKIVDCKIDAVQTKINFSAEGKIVTDKASKIKSKQELGTDYGLKAKSGIGKEWNEQADAFAKYVIGKTVDEVKGIAVNEEGVATDTDLTSSVTIHIGDFITTIEKAVANAKDLGAGSKDKLGLAVITDIADSTDATADAEGLAQAYSYYAAVTTDTDGKVTSSVLDASQGKVNFDTKGTITTDLTAKVQTKQELKDDYGMKAKSGIGKEWYEQANSFADYVKGKTLDGVKGIAVTDEGTAKDADLVSSVTVHIGPFIEVVEKAIENAAK
jgi:hypothetical protein